MDSSKSLKMVLIGLLFALILPAGVMAAGVSVECVYDDTANVLCDVYADTTGTNGFRSAGVQLATTNCTAVSATKNTDVWFFGDSAPGFPYDNSPDLSEPKNPNLIVGQLDTATASVVTGTRVKMGDVTFSRDDTVKPDITAGLARGGGSFVSFVDAVSGAPLDGTVSISTVVAERGDANGDGVINSTDYVAIRNLLSSPNPPPYADCNGDGAVNSTDYVCVRNKL